MFANFDFLIITSGPTPLLAGTVGDVGGMPAADRDGTRMAGRLKCARLTFIDRRTCLTAVWANKIKKGT